MGRTHHLERRTPRISARTFTTWETPQDKNQDKRREQLKLS